MKDNLITIRSFSNSSEFEIAKAYLLSMGIDCVGQDELINQIYVANVNGGVKLQVPSEQYEEALKLMIEGGYIKPDDFEPTPEFKWLNSILNKFRKKD